MNHEECHGVGNTPVFVFDEDCVCTHSRSRVRVGVKAMTRYTCLSLFFVITCASASEVVISRYVQQSDNVCIVAQFAATFYVDYVDVSGIPQTSTLEIGENAEVEKRADACDQQVLALNFENDRRFEIHFALNQSTEQTCVTRIVLSTAIDAVTFPGHADTGKQQQVVFTEPSFCSGKISRRRCLNS